MISLADTRPRFHGQADYIGSVQLFADQFSPGQPGHGSPNSFWWTYASRFKLSLLAGSQAEWRAFAQKESAAWREDYGEQNDADFEKWWLPNPSRSPVIVVEGTDQQFYVWDGNHRVGIAILNGLKTLPAVIGYRK